MPVFEEHGEELVFRVRRVVVVLWKGREAEDVCVEGLCGEDVLGGEFEVVDGAEGWTVFKFGGSHVGALSDAVIFNSMLGCMGSNPRCVYQLRDFYATVMDMKSCSTDTACSRSCT